MDTSALGLGEREECAREFENFIAQDGAVLHSLSTFLCVRWVEG